MDIDEETGTTAIWEGSHKQSDDEDAEDRFQLLGRLVQEPDYSMATKPLPRQGDVYLMDYRVIHGGLANRSQICLLYTSPSPRDLSTSRMPSSA